MADYEAAFAGVRNTDLEWAAGDGGAPVRLPDGRVVWIFGDTFIGRVQPDRSLAPGWGLVNNTIIVQEGACFRPLMGGTRGSRTDLIPDPGTNHWYWPNTGVVAGGALRVFLFHMAYDPSQIEGWEWRVDGVEIATFSLPDLTFAGTVRPASLNALMGPAAEFVMWGPGAENPGDGYVYVYGRNDDSDQHYVARVLEAQVTSGSWEFWAGDGQPWTTDPASASPMVFLDASGQIAPVAFGSPPQPGSRPDAHLWVSQHGSGYLASAKLVEVFSDDVSTWYAPSPAGPWQYVGMAAGPPPNPRARPDQILYLGRVVTDLPGGVPVAMWSSHVPGPWSIIAADTDLYKVHVASPLAGSLP